MAETSAQGRLSTGVPGLDTVLRGGLPRGSVYIVEGPPGAGKTILASQIAFHVAEQGGSASYLTLLAESHTRLLGHLRGLGFFRAEQVGRGVRYASGFKALETEGLPGLLRLTRELVTQQSTLLLVIDGLLPALEGISNQRDYRRFVHELQTLAAMTDCTVLLLTSASAAGFRPEHTMVDGILELTDEVNHLRSLRHLQVQKLRGSDPVRGRHTLSITQRGISIRPRVEAELLRLPEDAQLRPAIERAPFGLRELDDMLHGGLPERSTTMLLGPSGSGKTLLGLQFLEAGAARGELGVFFGFYERPNTLVEKAERVQLRLGDAQRRGLIEFLWEPFGEAAIDALGERLLKTVRELRPRRLFLDGIQGFQQNVDVPDRLGSVLSTIAEQLEWHEITTLYTVESEQLLGPMVRSPVRGLSAITHNILVLRHLERAEQLQRTITILKMRDSGYDPHTRELQITDVGLRLGEVVRRGCRPADFLESHGERQSRAPRARGSRGSILIVDDEFGLAELMSEILNERGYQTTIAVNGELGLQALREHAADLVLLDVMMPVLSGPEMRQQMLEDPSLAPVPVVLMTAVLEVVPRDQLDSYVAVLQKPFPPDKLFEAVERALGTAPRSIGSA
ncbi:MAG TPA: ATPase domain-containing protein [Polyangiaceae bacterium]|nr:ATPase domain-containing protein [Polyangiaceae bacterium]